MSEPLPGSTVQDGLIREYVMEPILWYQEKKKWPRRFHRATVAITIVAGAAIPVVSGARVDNAETIMAVLGGLVAVLNGLASTYRWERNWAIFTEAQVALESILADWRIGLEQIESGADAESERRRKRAELFTGVFARVREIRSRELASFFPSHAPSEEAGRGADNVAIPAE